MLPLLSLTQQGEQIGLMLPVLQERSHHQGTLARHRESPQQGSSTNVRDRSQEHIPLPTDPQREQPFSEVVTLGTRGRQASFVCPPNAPTKQSLT